MRFWVWCLLFTSFWAHSAVPHESEIYDIDYGHNKEDPFLLLTTGEVVWLTKADLPKVEAKFNKRAQTKAFFNRMDIDDDYTPTILENMDVAKTYFTESRQMNGASQCFNKAHVWSYEWFKAHQLLSSKTWLFFTRKYIRKFRHNWWFHVAPSIMVNEESVIAEKVMDKTFATRPLKVKDWTDIFVNDKASCPRVEKYSDYANYPESGSCFTMISSMFYHQPFDLESQETWNTYKPDWYVSDLKQAYMDAINEEFEGLSL